MHTYISQRIVVIYPPTITVNNCCVFVRSKVLVGHYIVYVFLTTKYVCTGTQCLLLSCEIQDVPSNC